MKDKRQSFSLLPEAPRKALERADLDFNEWGIYCYIVSAVDWRTGELVTTLPGLAGLLQWTTSPDNLRKYVRRLESRELIECETRPGPGATWIIRLGPSHAAALSLGVVPETIPAGIPAGEGPPGAGIIPAEDLNGSGANAVLMPSGEPENSSTRARALDQDQDKDKDEDQDQDTEEDEWGCKNKEASTKASGWEPGLRGVR